MAVTTIVNALSLEKGIILTPERYHPGRVMKISVDGIRLGEIIKLSKNNFTNTRELKDNNELYVLDTGDVKDGKIIGNKKSINKVNSQKKILQENDVIISRLRPYLKQVGLVDKELIKKIGDKTLMLSSTEFYVLSSIDSKSIAFLVPYLLSDEIQNILKNSVEGSQHPRFNENVLLSLLIPKTILTNRDVISESVIQSIKNYRIYEKGLSESIDDMSVSLKSVLN